VNSGKPYQLMLMAILSQALILIRVIERKNVVQLFNDLISYGRCRDYRNHNIVMLEESRVHLPSPGIWKCEEVFSFSWIIPRYHLYLYYET